MRRPSDRKRCKTRVRRASFETLEERSLLAALVTNLLPTSADFRSLDGSSNNLQYPDLGAANQQHLRQTSEDYADGISEPRGGDVSTLANPRLISNAVHAQGDKVIASAEGLSQMVFQFGQFLDHDITRTPEIDEPFNIAVPSGDLSFDPANTGTQEIPLNRSAFDLASGSDADNPRQQINTITSFIDGSVIYGSDDERALALRARQGGKMVMRDGGLLPLNGVDTVLMDNVNGTAVDPNSLFVSGDERVNEQIGLTAMHTLFSREHNYWADRIAADQFAGQDLSDPTIDQRIYQLARQIVGAELQIITYNEFLPAVLGDDAIGEYLGYDASVDPRISNVFATAAYRVGHTMLPNELSLIDSDGTLMETRSLADAFFQPQVVAASGIEPILRGLAARPQQEIDRFVVDGVRNFLFGPPGAGGLDLASLNIQRGRDHGLPTYNQVRIDFGLAPATSFADVTTDPQTQAALATAYATIDDVDVWVGGLAEDHELASNLGETFSTIWIDQFTRLRDGDRYFYKNQGLDANLVDELENTTLADIILRNTAIASLSDNVFQIPRSDFGDAADSGAWPRYPTLLVNDGARHTIGPLFLGTSVDHEMDGQPTAAADGDDSNGEPDDDGVVSVATLVTTGASHPTNSSFSVTATQAGKLDAWIDFNQDGDWNDPGEQIFVSVDVAAAANLLSFTIPPGAKPAETAARFRLSSAGGLNPTGEAADGEVEDYIVILADGDDVDGVDASVDVSGDAITSSIELGDLVIRNGQVDIFRAPNGIVGSLQITGTDGNETLTIDVSGGLEIPPRGLQLDGAGGDDTVVLVGDGVVIDLTQPLLSIRNIGTLDLSGEGAKTLTINAAIVTNLSPADKMLTIIAGEGDTIDFKDVDTWRMADPVMVGDRLMLMVENLAGGSETLRASMSHPWQNCLRRGDVDNDGEVTAGDALRIINELGRRQFSDRNTQNLMDPLSMESWPGAYFDHSGDDRVTALDALRVINDLARLAVDGESSESETLVAALNSPKSSVSWEVEEANESRPRPAADLIARGFDAERPVANFDIAATVVQQGYDPEQTARAVDQLLSDESFVDLL